MVLPIILGLWARMHSYSCTLMLMYPKVINMKSEYKIRRKLLPWYMLVMSCTTSIFFVPQLVNTVIGDVFYGNHWSSFYFYGYSYIGWLWSLEAISLRLISFYIGILSVLLLLGMRQSLLLLAIGYVATLVMGIFVFIQSGFNDFKLLTLFSFLMLLGSWKIKDKWYSVGVCDEVSKTEK